jgi:hypothetical protein
MRPITRDITRLPCPRTALNIAGKSSELSPNLGDARGQAGSLSLRSDDFDIVSELHTLDDIGNSLWPRICRQLFCAASIT